MPFAQTGAQPPPHLGTSKLAFLKVFYRGSVEGMLPGSGAWGERESKCTGMNIVAVMIRIHVWLKSNIG